MDPTQTLASIMLTYYWCINIGAFLQVATSYAAKYVGYALAFGIPGIIYMIMPLALWWVGKRLIKIPPLGSVTADAFRVIGTLWKKGGVMGALRGGDRFWDAGQSKASATSASSNLEN